MHRNFEKFMGQIYYCESHIEGDLKTEDVVKMVVPKNYNVFVHTKFGKRNTPEEVVSVMESLKKGCENTKVNAVYFSGDECPDFVLNYGDGIGGKLGEKTDTIFNHQHTIIHFRKIVYFITEKKTIYEFIDMPQKNGPFKLSSIFSNTDNYISRQNLKTNVIRNIHLVGGMEIRQKMSKEQSLKFNFVDLT